MTRQNIALMIVTGAACALVGMLAMATIHERRDAAQAGQAPRPGSVEVVDPSPGEPGYEPVTRDAARTAAQTEFDRYALGDWAGAWDLWTKAGKAAISRSDYHDFHARCGTLTGLRLNIIDVRVTGKTAGVSVERGGMVFSETMIHEDGRWRYQPKPEALADYKLGVEKMLQKGRSEGKCVND